MSPICEIKNKVIKASAIFLGKSSLFMLINELLFRFFNDGLLLHALSSMPGATIGFFEAHGLAFIWAVFIYRSQKKGFNLDIHLFSAILHLFLVIANVIFWNDSFIRFNFTWVGYLSTALNFILAVIHSYIYLHTQRIKSTLNK